jgi:hypothetical protein
VHRGGLSRRSRSCDHKSPRRVLLSSTATGTRKLRTATPCAVLNASSLAPTVRAKGALSRQKEWRDSESNRGHHDFQGRVTGPGNAQKVLQISGPVSGRAVPRYPWFTVVARGLRTWRAARALFGSFTSWPRAHCCMGPRASARSGATGLLLVVPSGRLLGRRSDACSVSKAVVAGTHAPDRYSECRCPRSLATGGHALVSAQYAKWYVATMGKLMLILF